MFASLKTAVLRAGPIDHEAYLVDGSESISQLFRYVVHVRHPLPLPRVGEIVGAAGAIVLDDAFGSTRAIAGIVTEAQAKAFDDKLGELVVVIEPHVKSLAVGRRSRSFQDTSVLDVARTVLGEAGVPFREEITKTYGKAPYRSQLRESSWSFVARLLESEGIHFYFDTDGSGALILSDDSSLASPMVGAAPLPVLAASGLSESVECIQDLAATSRAGSTTVSGKSFSWSNPSLGLSASHGAGRYEAYDAGPAGPSTPSALSAHTARVAARLKARASSVAGKACSMRLAPGHRIDIVGADDPSLDGSYHVTHTRIVTTGSDRTFITEFEAGRLDVPFVPETKTKVPSQAGIAWGEVVADAGDEVFPDESGRVRVQMKWDREGGRDASSGTWMRVAQRGAPGSLLIPRTGWVVATWNEGGTPDTPYVLSRIHDGEHPPAYPLPENKTRVVYKTATVPGGGTFNEIHFEDKVGEQNQFWNASKDMIVHTKNQKGELVRRDATHAVGRMQTIRHQADSSLYVGLDQSRSIGHDENVHVHGTATQSIKKNETIRIGGSRSLDVGSTHTSTTKANRSLSVGAAEIDISLGTITQSTKVGLELVGAAKVFLTPQTRTDGGDKVSVQMVGGMLIEKVAENAALDVKGDLTETVGGSFTSEAGTRWADTTVTSASWTVGATLKVTSKDVNIEAKEKIEIRCGASSLVLTKDSISISTTKFLLEGSELEAVTGIIKHN